MITFARRRRRPAATYRVGLCAAALSVVSLVAAGCGLTDDAEATINRSPTLVEKGALTVCTNMPYPPFEFMQDGKAVGFDIDLVKEVAKAMKVRTVIVPMGFDVIESGQALNNGRCDVAVAALTINGDRARVLDFSSPYFNAEQAMVVSSVSGIDSLDDLSGLRIAVQEGSTGEIYVTDNAPRDAEIVPFGETSEIDAALSAGEVEAAVYDNVVVDEALSRNPEFEIAERFDTVEQYGMAVKKNSNVELLRTINRVLAEIQAPGDARYDTIYTRWIGERASEQ